MTDIEKIESLHTRLREAILSEDPYHRYQLLDEIGKVGLRADRDLELLLELLDPKYHWYARSLSVWEIGKLGPDAVAAVPALTNLTLESDTMIDPRWASLWALEHLGPASAEAVPTLRRIVASDSVNDMRSGAAWALGATGIVEGVVDTLVEALDDDDSLVREEAANALGRIGPAAAAASVTKLERVASSDEVRPTREKAALALRRFGEREAADRADARAAGLPVPMRLPKLLELLQSDDGRVRAESSWELGKLGRDAAAGASVVVRQLRTDSDQDARWGAAWCVGRITPPEAVSDVIEAISSDPDPDVRAQAIQGLGRIGVAEPEVIETLVMALGDAGASLVREEAAGALARLGSAAGIAVPSLRAHLTDPHPLVRQRARAALATINEEF